MTGKSDENGTDAAAWLAGLQTLLMVEVTAAAKALTAARPKEGADSAALDRHARAVTSLARAAKAAASLTETPGRGRPRTAGEQPCQLFCGVVTLDAAPGEGAAVTAGFEFDTPVRFDADRIEVTLETFEAGRMAAAPLIEVRV